MTPVCKIEANEVDITNTVRGRLISGTLKDSDGIKSDSFELVLDDRDNAVALPPPAAELKVWLGYEESGLDYMGLYVFDDDARLDGPPDRIVLRSTAARFGTSTTLNGIREEFRKVRSCSWSGLTIADVTRDICKQCGFTARISPDCEALKFPNNHAVVHNESYAHFLARTTTELRSVKFRVLGSYLVLAPHGTAETATGRNLVPVALEKSALSSWSLQLDDRSKFVSVKARWSNVADGQVVEVEAGSGSPSKMLPRTYASELEAKTAAEGELARIQMGNAEVSLSLPGNPAICAGGFVDISGLRREYNRRWFVREATHSFSDSGYTTTFKGQPLEAI